MRVLLVGGGGFMGGRTASLMAGAGHEVTVLSRGRRPLPPGAQGLVTDRRDTAALAAALEHRRFDFTVDFVAFDAGDVEGLLRVPYAALGRYVLVSSGSVYLVTQGSPPVWREEDSDAPLMPEPAAGTPEHGEWSYGTGKRRAEQALLALRASHGVRGVILRPPVVQGEGDPSLRLWAWIERMMDGGPVPIPGGGAARVRFLHAGDMADALLRLLEGGAPPGAVYNLAQPDVVTLRDFLERVARAAGLTPRFVPAGEEELEGAGIPLAALPYASRWSSVLEPARAAGEWGFAGTRLDDYLPAVVRWHLENRPAGSHPGYESRPRELELAARGAPA